MVDRYYGVKDNARTGLAGSITSGQTTLNVADATVFSGAETPFLITVAVGDDSNMEMMVVTNVAGNTLTVTRNFAFGAKSHLDGEAVTLRVVAQHSKDLVEHALMQPGHGIYVDTPTKNGNGQVTEINIYTDSGKVQKVIKTTFTYSDTLKKYPATATRLIYKGDGTTVRRTESVTFTYDANGVLINHDRVIV